MAPASASAAAASASAAAAAGARLALLPRGDVADGEVPGLHGVVVDESAARVEDLDGWMN